MPTNPVNPTSNAAVDRLTLGVDRARESDAVSSGPFPCGSLCGCFEADASGISMCACGCACSEIED